MDREDESKYNAGWRLTLDRSVSYGDWICVERGEIGYSRVPWTINLQDNNVATTENKN